MNPTLWLVAAGALLMVLGIFVAIRRSRPKGVTVEPAGPQRALSFAFAVDDVRAPVEALDPDLEDPFLKSLRDATPLVVPDFSQPHVQASTEPIAQHTIGTALLERPDPVVFETPVNIVVPLDPDEGPVDFSGLGTLDDAERRRLLEDLESKLSPSDEEEHVVPLAEASERSPLVFREDAVREPGEVLRTYRWTAFIAPEAQSLGDPEREILITMLGNLHESHWCVPVLLNAFNEEGADGLRPLVVETLYRSYHHDSLRSIYEYCAAHGSDREREVAAEALERLS